MITKLKRAMKEFFFPDKTFTRTKFCSPRLLTSLLHDNRAAVYDMRTKELFEEKRLRGSINVDPVMIKTEILKHHHDDHILLVSEFPRTFIFLVTWARKEGYKNVLVVENFEAEGNRRWLVRPIKNHVHKPSGKSDIS